MALIFDVESVPRSRYDKPRVRQSMRRKMLLDTYLAEQSRRSIKNKERRTKQRVEAVVLADAKKQYEKDLATYKQKREMGQTSRYQRKQSFDSQIPARTNKAYQKAQNNTKQEMEENVKCCHSHSLHSSHSSH